jgi:regulation of enolase protein 1 (concanavalin A-like superfamily)
VYSLTDGRKKSLLSACIPVLEDLEGRQLFATIQALPYNLDFSSDKGGILDKDGTGTGFTNVQANKNGTQYNASLIDLDTTKGVLKITTTAGSNSGTTDNTQVDALESQFDATSGAFTIQSRLIGPLSFINAQSDQGGIYFGPDQDNFVKLVAVDGSSGPVLQFKDEIGGSTTPQLPSSVQNVNIGSFSSITTLDLRLVGDPSSGKVVASYSINGGSFVMLSSALTLTGTNKTNFFSSVAHAGVMANNKGAATPITVTYDSFSITSGGTVATGHPSATQVRPRDGTNPVSRDAFIAVDVNLPNSGIDPTTLNGNVLLYRTSDHKAIAGVVNTSGGGDAIVFTPSDLLDANTSYTFQITAGVKDTSGATFVPFTSSFTTGTAGGNDGTMTFDKEVQSVSQGNTYTCVTVGPDHKLYATTIDGLIIRFTINADGSLGASQTITTINDNNGGAQVITSITFDPSSTASNLIAYVSHSAPSLTNAPDWSGKISKLTGANLQNYTNLVYGLPRSIRDHMNNQLVFGPDGKLYFGQAANNAMGAPDKAWGMRPDHLLNDAVLQLDLSKLSSGSPLNVQTDSIANPYNPFAANAPLKIYADGVRNTYDLLWATNGHLYASVNGSAAGGNTPASPNPAFSNSRIDEAVYGDYTGPVVPGITNNQQTEDDWLDDIKAGKYYGHPNPTRYEWVMNGGNPTSGTDPFEVPQYPVGTQPDRNYQPPVFDYGQNVSPDGMIQYSGNAFGGALNGKIMVVRYSGGDDIEVLTPNADGSIAPGAQTGITGAKGFDDPVDLTEDNSSGFIYVAEYSGQQITLLKPVNGSNVKTSQSTMYFNDVKSGSTDPGSTAKSETLTVTNNGTTALVLSSGAFSITGTDASQFSVVNPGAQTLVPGASLNVTINFNATSVGIKTATLSIMSNAATVTVALRGIGMNGTEVANGLNEPSLQRILDLFQIPDNVGEPNPDQTAFPSTPTTPNDEVSLQQLVKAGDGNVSIQLLSVFDNIKNPATEFGYYTPGTPADSTRLFTVPTSGAQSVDPTTVGNTTFDPGSSEFSLYTIFPAFTNRASYEEDSLNTWDTTNPRKVRFYPLKNSDGSVVPNAYVFAFEDYNKAYDFNDVVGIIRNVKAAPSGAQIGMTNLDGGLFDHLAMDRIDNLDPLVPNVTHDTASLLLRNTGNSTLHINSMTLNGPFTFVSGGSTTSIAAGGSVTLRIKFTGVGTGLVSMINGTLVINTDAVNSQTETIQLAGLWQKYSEQDPNGVYGEPSLQQIVNVFGYTTTVAYPNQVTTKGTYVQFAQHGEGAAVGEEILSPYWQRADGNAPVQVQLLAAFHKESSQDANGNLVNTNSVVKWFYQGSSTSATTLFKHQQDEGQSLLPHLDTNASAYAIGTFTPNSNSFGFKVDSRYSDDTLNPSDFVETDPNQTPIPGTGHAFRFYALKDANGNVIPNTYLMAMDYTGISYSNYDYQDNIYIISNVMPASPPVAPSGLSANGTANGNNLTWTANSAGNIGGYRVYRSDTANGTYTLLNTTLLTTPNYLDINAPAGATSFYHVTAVNLDGKESPFASASATRPNGSGVTVNAPTNLAVNSPSSSEVDLSWSDNSNNETGFKVMRKTGAGGTYSTIFTTNANAITYQDMSVVAGNTYFYEIVATTGSVDSSASNEQSITVQGQQQQAFFTSADIGNPTPGGSTTTITDGSDYDVTAGGANIWGTSDQFHYDYEQVTGDFDVKVQITGMNAADPKAKAGIMARSSLAANASNAYMRLNPIAANGPRYSYRTTTGGTSGTFGSGTGTAPMWVRLQRVGNTFTGYTSPDGVTWTVVGSSTITMGSSIFLGLATVSDTAGQTVVANYRGFSNTSAPIVTIPNAPTGLSANAPSPNEVDLNWTDNSNNETGFKIQRRTTGGTYQTIFTTAPGASSYQDMSVSPNTTYFYQVIATNSAGDSSPTNEFQISTPQPAQPTFTSVDIGAPTPAGSTTTITDGSDYNVTAGGANIWGTSDQFHFDYEQITGDFDVKVQVLSMNASDPKAKAGLMARSSLNANAANAFMRLNPVTANGPRLSYRGTDGGTSSTQGSGTGTAPMWVRLQRSGNTFLGYVSTDGVNWVNVGSTSIPMGSTIYLGLATASDTAGQTVAAQYRSFGNTNSAPPAVTVPNAPTGLSANAPSSSEVDLAWTDNSNNETGFKVQRRTAGGTYQTIFTTVPGANSYADTTVAPGMQYFYQIVATNSAGDSSPSNEFGITTPSTTVTHTFASNDIGNPSPAGSTNALASDQYDVTGGGTDVWNASDQTQFESTQLTGDFDIRVRVNSASFATGTNPLLGLMARETLDAGSKNVFMRTYGAAAGQFKFASRSTTGGTSTSVGSGANSLPATNTWLRLTRVGNTFTGYSSTDGVTWTAIGSTTISMAQTILVGMAVTSRAATTATVQFRDLTIQ